MKPQTTNEEDKLVKQRDALLNVLKEIMSWEENAQMTWADTAKSAIAMCEEGFHMTSPDSQTTKCNCVLHSAPGEPQTIPETLDEAMASIASAITDLVDENWCCCGGDEYNCGIKYEKIEAEIVRYLKAAYEKGKEDAKAN